MTGAPSFAAVALDVPLDVRFTYAIPPALRDRVVRGVRVVVPFRAGAKTGVVLEVVDALPASLDAKRVRPIADVLDAAPAVREPQLSLCEWMARYYHANIGEAVRLATPTDGAGRSSRRVTLADGTATAADLPPLTETQSSLLEALRSAAAPLDPSALVRSVAGAVHADLDALERAGAVASIYAADGQIGPKTQQNITLVAPDDRPLGLAQRRLIAWLDEHGTCTDAALRRDIGTPRSVIRALSERGIIRVETIEVPRDPFQSPLAPRERDPVLSEEQRLAMARFAEARAGTAPKTMLLHGVTGSGKTEVYLRAAREVIADGRRVLVLLPEIALTPQFVGVFRSALRCRIAVLHSALSAGERSDEWRRIGRGEVDTVIGARSALFAPLESIGLIVVDEEHDGSFKQQDGVPYNARDAALVLAQRFDAVCMLGSATPSLESLHNAQRGRYALVTLARRVEDRPMPEIEIVDMSDQAPTAGDPSEFISPPLAVEVRNAARRGEQAILFINRRGFAPSLQCRECGTVVRCTNCDIAMTVHRGRGQVVCHYCGAAARTPRACPTCQSVDLDIEGAGTERVESLIVESFSDLRVGRLDRDTSRGRGLHRVLDAFRRGDLDVLVGTQMVTKGHDFPRVTFVGVIDADQALRFPDFRSGERAFQLLTQVTGRAGRDALPGKAILQTYRPDHYVIEAVRVGDFDGFAETELAYRERLTYPPFGHVYLLRLDGPNFGETFRFAERLTEAARLPRDRGVRVLGPTESPVARVRGRFRVQSLVRCAERAPLHESARQLRSTAVRAAADLARSDVRWSLDIDPVRLL